MLFNPDTAARGRSYFLPAFEAAAQSSRITPIKAPVRSDAEIEAIIASLGTDLLGGLISMPDAYMNAHRATTIRLAVQHRVPAVYNGAPYVRDGGLLSYGVVIEDIFRRAAGYVIASENCLVSADRPSSIVRRRLNTKQSISELRYNQTACALRYAPTG
jgi:putative ABC transport system substrate-binding protein